MPDWNEGSDTESFPTYGETMVPDYNDFSNVNLASLWGGALPSYGGQDFYTNVGGGGDNYQLGINSAWMPEAQKNGISFQGRYGDNGLYSQMMQNGQSQGIRFQSYNDPMFGLLIDLGVSGVLGGASFLGGGGGLAGTLGYNGALGSAINGAATGGLISAGNGQNVLQGALSGGLGGYAGGSNFAKDLGVTNPIGAKALNAGIGGVTGAIAGGASGGDALKAGANGGLMAGITQGLNQMGSGISNFWGGFNGGSQDLESLQGSGGDMGGQTDFTPSSYNEDSSNYRYSGDQAPNTYGSTLPPQQQEVGQKQATGFSMPSMGNVGNFIGNNAGNLASMLYGFYNNRRQQGAINSQMNGLQGMFGQGSPYAKQLEAKLTAQAAARGTRSNVTGREVQLQAALAQNAAALAPTLFNMQNAKGQLQNSMGSNLLNSFNQMGGIRGLQGLFSPPTYQNGGANITGNQNEYGSDNIFNGWQ